MKIKIQMTREDNIAHFGSEPVELPLEEYFCGVVPAEVYESSAMDALKAQAVTARTFALRHALAGTVIDDTASYQAYRYGLLAFSPQSRQAVEETAGQVLHYDGTLIDCFYSLSNGGQTKRSGANNTHISFEICEDGLTDAAYLNKAYQEAVELCAYLCKMYGFDPLKDGVIIGHFEGYKRGIASNHGDPHNWFPKHGKSMDTFRAAVKSAMGGGSVTPAPAPETLYRVRESWSDAKSQKGAFKILDNAKRCADENIGYLVFDEKGAVVYSGKASKAVETYTVKKGDTLWGIAASKLGSGTRYLEIKALNRLTSDTINVGQVLKIPR